MAAALRDKGQPASVFALHHFDCIQLYVSGTFRPSFRIYQIFITARNVAVNHFVHIELRTGMRHLSAVWVEQLCSPQGFPKEHRLCVIT